MNLSFWIARRLDFKPEGRKKRSPGVGIAIGGVAVAVAIMLMSLGVVMGFKNSIRAKVMGLESEITISSAFSNIGGNEFVPDSSFIAGLKEVLPAEATIGSTLQTSALLKTDDNFLGVALRGLSPGSAEQQFIAENLTEGEFPDYSSDENSNKVVISKFSATSMQLQTGDSFFLHFFVDDAVKTRKATVAGIYDTGFAERDRYMLFGAQDLIRKVDKLPQGSVSYLGISGLPVSLIEPVCDEVQGYLLHEGVKNGEGVLVAENIFTNAAIYFNWLDLLDTNVVAIIVLMGLVAGFTLISCLFILILERVKMIGLLKALGMRNVQIRRIFVFIALRIVVIGMVIGNFFALGIMLAQQKFSIIPLDPEAYFLDSVPVDIIPWQVVMLNIGVIVVAALVLFVPTIIISGISPASTMRYE